MKLIDDTWYCYPPVSVDTAEKFRLQIHVVETDGQHVSRATYDVSTKEDLLVNDLVPVGLNLAFDVLELISMVAHVSAQILLKHYLRRKLTST